MLWFRILQFWGGGSAEEPEASEVEMLSTLIELLMEAEHAKGIRVCFLHVLRAKQHQTNH